MSEQQYGSHRAPASANDTRLSRSAQLDRALSELLAAAPELEAAAVVSFDGLAMASILPLGMEEDRVAAMSAALLSLGEKAAQGLGRGDLSQVYVEGESGTVFLVSAEDEAVLVAVAARGAKTGLMLYEVRRGAATVANILRADDPTPIYGVPEPVADLPFVPTLAPPQAAPYQPLPTTPATSGPVLMSVPPTPTYDPGPAPWPISNATTPSSLAQTTPAGWS